MRDLVRVLSALILATAALAAAPSAAEDFKTGEMIDKSSWQKAENLLPPEILKHYKEGDYQNKFVDWPASQYTWAPDFKAGTDANEGKFAIGDLGTLVDKTGKRPPYIIGHPFPKIDAGDPAAAVKILWNHFYRTWYFGNLYAESQINWVSPTALERRADVQVSFAYYDGIPQDELPPSNPRTSSTGSCRWSSAPPI
jgi:hypothetical protein